MVPCPAGKYAISMPRQQSNDIVRGWSHQLFLNNSTITYTLVWLVVPGDDILFVYAYAILTPMRISQAFKFIGSCTICGDNLPLL
jgi:hypothetical protein